MQYDNWRPCSELPDPGQDVLLVYEREDGTSSDIIIWMPVHEDGTTCFEDGRPYYRPTLWWMPLPAHPVRES